MHTRACSSNQIPLKRDTKVDGHLLRRVPVSEGKIRERNREGEMNKFII